MEYITKLFLLLITFYNCYCSPILEEVSKDEYVNELIKRGIDDSTKSYIIFGVMAFIAIVFFVICIYCCASKDKHAETQDCCTNCCFSLSTVFDVYDRNYINIGLD
ncbi:hypothetical protein BCR32DRAFT_283030 [Anaeromyces robustus]|uniref:Uncharacterized protein n=1 Tax=Anaeromyces robustus TaxID=1754192 RepID=A0A1Y1WVM9_9FUNG|nr:hypothetical protein BCR32DRAFT_283030 [Anaeromyces robustus]|eukprot:ORX77619.1 hypothetical protein BCR32DRAFT_283030 [Anaeromyces robustus]